MITVPRFFAVTSASACLLGACAIPTEESNAEDPAHLGEELPALSHDPEAAAPGEDASTLKARCNYGDAGHCMGAQQGWRWVPIRRRSSPGDSHVVATGNYCCVRAGPRPPPMPEE